MSIELPDDTRKQLLASLKRYAEERLDIQLDDLPAALLLDYILKEIGPSIYNRAIADAQAYLVARAGDMEGVLFETEFGYWDSGKNVVRRKTR